MTTFQQFTGFKLRNQEPHVVYFRVRPPKKHCKPDSISSNKNIKIDMQYLKIEKLLIE